MHRLIQSARARRPGLPGPDTDAFRLVDGTGDGLPDVEIEEWAGRWLVATRLPSLPPALRDFLLSQDRTIYHKHLDQHQKESPRHLCGQAQDSPFVVRENNIAFEASFRSGYSQGLFLDQRDNRRRVRELLHPGQTLLNTFAYTGAFSVAAALAGARTTTLDLAQPCLDWAKRNFLLNSLDPDSHHFCKGDTFHWLRRFAKQGRRFDAIVLDPPTFSRDDQGKVFRAERDFGQLAALAAACTAPDGWLLCTTNCRKLTTAAFSSMIRGHLPGPCRLSSHPMPPDFTGEPYLKTILVFC